MNSRIIDEWIVNRARVAVIMNFNRFDGYTSTAYSHKGTIKRSDDLGVLLENEEGKFFILYANIIEIELLNTVGEEVKVKDEI